MADRDEMSDAGREANARLMNWNFDLADAVEEFLDTIPAMPQVEHVAGRYRWTAKQYKALIKLNNTFHGRRG